MFALDRNIFLVLLVSHILRNWTPFKTRALYLRFDKFCVQYALKLRSHPDNLDYDVVFNPQCYDLYDKKPSAIRCFGNRVEDLSAVCPQLDLIQTVSLPDDPNLAQANGGHVCNKTLYISPVLDPNVMAVVELTISWGALDSYAFYPIALIPKLIEK